MEAPKAEWIYDEIERDVAKKEGKHLTSLFHLVFCPAAKAAGLNPP